MYKANAIPRINLSPTISDCAHLRADDATYDIRPYDMTTNSAYHDANSAYHDANSADHDAYCAYHDANSAYHDAVPRQGKNK